MKNTVSEFFILGKLIKPLLKLAEGRGFEPPVALRLLLISSQMPLTTQPPFHPSIQQLIALNLHASQIYTTISLVNTITHAR